MKSEDHIVLSAKVRRVRLPRGQRARHVIQGYHGNLGDPAYSSKKEYGKQPIKREDIKQSAGSRIAL